MSKHEELLGKNKCPCTDCRAFRKARAKLAGRARMASVNADPSSIGRLGQEGLVARFRKEVVQEAKARGIALSEDRITGKAKLRRDHHMSKLALERLGKTS